MLNPSPLQGDVIYGQPLRSSRLLIILGVRKLNTEHLELLNLMKPLQAEDKGLLDCIWHLELLNWIKTLGVIKLNAASPSRRQGSSRLHLTLGVMCTLGVIKLNAASPSRRNESSRLHLTLGVIKLDKKHLELLN